MARRKDFIKASTYTGQALKGDVSVYLKIDGVRLLYRDGKIVTRNDKEPPGLAFLPQEVKDLIKLHGDVELYKHGVTFGEISGTLNSKSRKGLTFTTEDVYPLLECDERLKLDFDRGSLNKEQLKEVLDVMLNAVVERGYEGLIIRTVNGSKESWYRHKPSHTADVRITGYFEQKDKHGNLKGVLGGFETPYGNVTAMSDELREELWKDPASHVGRLCEVQYKELYPNGSFRFGVKFMHFRDDKDEESFDKR